MDGMKMQITFCVDPEEFTILKQKASEQSTSVSELVHEIINSFLETDEKNKI